PADAFDDLHHVGDGDRRRSARARYRDSAGPRRHAVTGVGGDFQLAVVASPAEHLPTGAAGASAVRKAREPNDVSQALDRNKCRAVRKRRIPELALIVAAATPNFVPEKRACPTAQSRVVPGPRQQRRVGRLQLRRDGPDAKLGLEAVLAALVPPVEARASLPLHRELHARHVTVLPPRAHPRPAAVVNGGDALWLGEDVVGDVLEHAGRGEPRRPIFVAEPPTPERPVESPGAVPMARKAAHVDDPFEARHRAGRAARLASTVTE